MKQWADGFKGLYPNVAIDIDAKGSAMAPPALAEGASQLGPMSRPMEKKETDAFQAKYGYAPTSTSVAVDVNRNPNQALDRTVEEFLKYVLSKDGQAVTIKAGFYPIATRSGSII